MASGLISLISIHMQTEAESVTCAYGHAVERNSSECFHLFVKWSVLEVWEERGQQPLVLVNRKRFLRITPSILLTLEEGFLPFFFSFFFFFCVPYIFKHNLVSEHLMEKLQRLENWAAHRRMEDRIEKTAFYRSGFDSETSCFKEALLLVK